MDAYALTISEAASMIKALELGPVELTESVLTRIERVEPLVNAFATVTADYALASARVAEAEIAGGGYRGPLHGIPLGVKDIYETAGVLTTASSKVRAAYLPDTDSAVVARLADAGMIMVGKTHTHEFAMGAFTPTTRNPWHLDHIPGGSSGGSGAAVAAGECLVGLGSDTGGSIRIPASLCGTVGLKPTYGLVSRAGVASVSWSLDHVGPLTKTVRDTALVLDAVVGYDRRDPATLDIGAGGYTAALDGRAADDLAGVRVGVPTNWFFDDCDPEVETAARAAIAELGRRGATLVDVEIPLVTEARAAQQVILRAEAAAYHRRMLRASGELYTAQVRQFMAPGTLVLAVDYVDAQRIRTLVQQAWTAMVTAAEIDVVAAPTCPVPAPARATGTSHTWPSGLVEDPHRTVTRYSGIANLTGIPSLTVPVGSSAAGLPIGVQLMGRPFGEATVLRAGYALEQTRTRETPVLP